MRGRLWVLGCASAWMTGCGPSGEARLDGGATDAVDGVVLVGAGDASRGAPAHDAGARGPDAEQPDGGTDASGILERPPRLTRTSRFDGTALVDLGVAGGSPRRARPAATAA